jgi:tetratricopeptide (TPR) repeat protein
MGRDNDALKEFQRVVELDPTRASAHNAIGIIYARHSPWEKCIPEFEKAIQLKPSADMYTNLATAYFNAGHYAESIPLFEKAVQLNPTEVVTVGNLADSYRQAKQGEKARVTYDRAIALAYKQLEVNPQDAATLGFLALFYAKTGAAAKAHEVIGRARTINAANNQLMYDEALVDALGARPQESLKALRRALENGYSVDEARLDPDLASVRVLPGFEELEKKTQANKPNSQI